MSLTLLLRTNILFSWGSGANPWGPEKDDQFNKPNHWDGMLEVVGVTGVVHLGQIQSGLRGAMRIAQVTHIHYIFEIHGPSFYEFSLLLPVGTFCNDVILT